MVVVSSALSFGLRVYDPDVGADCAPVSIAEAAAPAVHPAAKLTLQPYVELEVPRGPRSAFIHAVVLVVPAHGVGQAHVHRDDAEHRESPLPRVRYVRLPGHGVARP